MNKVRYGENALQGLTVALQGQQQVSVPSLQTTLFPVCKQPCSQSANNLGTASFSISATYLECLNIGTLKIIDFTFVPTGKSKVFGVSIYEPIIIKITLGCNLPKFFDT